MAFVTPELLRIDRAPDDFTFFYVFVEIIFGVVEDSATWALKNFSPVFIFFQIKIFFTGIRLQSVTIDAEVTNFSTLLVLSGEVFREKYKLSLTEVN